MFLLRRKTILSNKFATDLSILWIVETLNELQTRGFAASGSADKCHRFAAVDLQIQSSQHLNVLPRRITELDVLEFNLAVDGLESPALLAQTVDRRHAIEKLEDRGRGPPRHRERLEMRRGQAHVLRPGKYAEEHDHQYRRRVLLHLLRAIVQD